MMFSRKKKNTQRGHIKCKQIVDEKNSTTHHGLLDAIVDGTLIASWGTVKKKKKLLIFDKFLLYFYITANKIKISQQRGLDFFLKKYIL